MVDFPETGAGSDYGAEDGASPFLAPDATSATAETSSPHAGAPEERLEARVVPYWLISGLLSLAVLAAIVLGAIALFGDKLPIDSGAVLVSALVALGMLAAWTVAAPFLAYVRWRFSITEELLLARYGIIFHEEKAIPISRLQHVDLTRGPVERLFGLATLIVFTAGTEGASFRLPGLAVLRAREMRDLILAARGDDVI